MPKYSPEQAFGQLRGLLHQRATPVDELVKLLKKARRDDPQRYDAEWLPYLRQPGAPTIEIEDAKRLNTLAPLLPPGYPLKLILRADPLRPRTLKSLLESPWLSWIWSLECAGRSVESDALNALCAAPLNGLRHLSLPATTMHIEQLRRLIYSPFAPQLESLSLAHIYPEDDFFGLLAQAEHMRSLRALSFAQSPKTVESFTAFCQSEHLGQLRSLTLRLPHTCFKALSSATLFQGLTSLTLSCEHGNTGDFKQLFGAPKETPLRSLTLNNVELKAAHFEALAQAKGLQGLEHLSLSCANVEAAPPDALLTSGLMASLRSLHIHNLRSLDHAALQRWVDEAPLARLESLTLRACGLSLTACQILASAQRLTSLRSLALPNNPLQDDGVGALLKAPFIPQLEALNLARCSLETPSVAHLVRAPLDRLKQLSLTYMPVDERAGELLAAWPGLARLEQLDLAHGGFTEEGFLALSRSPHLNPKTTILYHTYELELIKNGILKTGDPKLGKMFRIV